MEEEMKDWLLKAYILREKKRNVVLISVLECLEDFKPNFLTNSLAYLDCERKIPYFSYLIYNPRKKVRWYTVLISNSVSISSAKLRTRLIEVTPKTRSST